MIAGALVIASTVFLSYAHEESDKLFVAELHKRLKRDGIECFFDEDLIAPGANFVLTISAAIDECNYLVMVMSPAYFSPLCLPFNHPRTGHAAVRTHS